MATNISFFENAVVNSEPVLIHVLNYLTAKESHRFSFANRSIHDAVLENYFSEHAASNGNNGSHYRAMGDEIIWQRRTADGIEFINMVFRNSIVGWKYCGDFSESDGPTGEIDALEFSEVGAVVRLDRSVDLGLEWTICTWTLFRDGQPYRNGFAQPEGWIEGEHALVCSSGDNSQVFYSEGRGNWLGCFCEDTKEEGYEENLHHGPGAFFSSQYSFQNISDGWHHVAAVGSKWRLGMDWNAKAENGNGSTRYYVDGTLTGAIPFNLTTEIQFIGNVAGYDFEEEERTQPWGKVADFRMFRRALSSEEIKFIMIRPVQTTDILFNT